MQNSKRILIIDDSEEVSKLLEMFLTRNGYMVESAPSGLAGIDLVKSFHPDVIFLDIDMPGMSGLEVQSELNRLGITTPVIIITGYSSMQTAVLTIRSGAYDYITKPFNLERIGIILRRCLEDAALQKVALSGESKQSSSIKFDLIGSSAAMVEVYKAIANVSRADPRVSVLITGETGAGKELVARQIHIWGKTSRAPFVALNMTALPDNLIESELFGHEKGSFTGATARRIGKLELAGNGTLLLDEIGDVSLHLQHKLLRVLQEREFYRLGGSDAISLQARVIASTNRDIVKSISSGSFREDLYYRLNVIPIAVPPLRLRSEDIPSLIRHFVQKHAEGTEKPTPSFSDEALRHLSEYSWPGNVRQLENIILRTLTAATSQVITPVDIPLETLASQDEADLASKATNLNDGRRLAVEQFEKKFLEAALRKAQGNVAKAAQEAGVNRESFYRLMRKFNIGSKS